MQSNSAAPPRQTPIMPIRQSVARTNLHVRIPWSKPDRARSNHGVLIGFLHSQRTALIQSLRQRASKQLRHMLHDQHRNRKVRGQPRQQLLQCRRSPRRQPNHDQLDRRKRLRGHYPRRSLERTSGAAPPSSILFLPLRALGQFSNSRQQLLRQRKHCRSKVSLLRGLRHIVRSAARQRLQRRPRSTLRMRTAHDHGQTGTLHLEPAQNLQPIQPRHLEIQHQHVRRQPLHRLQAIDPILCTPAQLHARKLARPILGMRSKQLSHHAAHYRRVVRSKNAERPFIQSFHVCFPQPSSSTHSLSSDYTKQKHLLTKAFGGEWLHQKLVRTVIERRRYKRVIGLGRHHHYLHFRPQLLLTQLLHALQTVHHGHVHIEQHQIERLRRCQHRQRIAAILRLFAHNIHSIQQVPQILADKARIINDQGSHLCLRSNYF